MNIKEFVQNTVRRALALYESTRPTPTLAVTSKTLWSGTYTVGGNEPNSSLINLSENDTNYDIIEIFGYVTFSAGDGTSPMLLCTYYTDNVTNGMMFTFVGVSQSQTSPTVAEGKLKRTNSRVISDPKNSYNFTFTRVVGRKYVQST